MGRGYTSPSSLASCSPLLEMTHAVCSRRTQHGFAVHPAVLNTVSQQLDQMGELLARHVLFEVVGEHPSSGAAAPGAVLRLVVEEQHVAGSRFHRAGRYVIAMHPPYLLGAVVA